MPSMSVSPAPYALSVDSGGDAFAVTTAEPRLSWKHPVDGPEIFVVEATVEDSDPVTAEVSGHLFVAWPFDALRSKNRVQWRVREAASEDSTWSEHAVFEVGLLDQDWTAAWISPAEPTDPGYGERPAYVLSGAFGLPDDVVSARLYATALGVYTATVNGCRVGGDELAPGSTSYDRTLYAQAHDVTSLLVGGDNRVEIELSDGWYRGQVGAFRLPSQWGTATGVRVELHAQSSDGTVHRFGSDETWKSASSLTTRADLMGGQTVDFSSTRSEPVPVRVGAVADVPRIDYSPAPPVRVVQTLLPAAVREIRNGVWVIDFGQNASGWVRLGDLGVPGTRTVIEYGEYVDASGDLSTAHLDSKRPDVDPIPFIQRDEVIAGAAGDVFEPRHTVHGFQYVRITRPGGRFDAAAIAMQVVHTDLVPTGSFVSSDDDLNRLHAIAEWSFRGNAVDVPTDCPTRERLAWTGDYQVFAPTATRLYDVLGFTRKWLRSVRDDQLDDGRIANFSPDGRRIKHHLDDQFAMMTGSSGWGDAIVAVPWEMYLSYGDRDVLEENYNAMVRWIDWALDQARTSRHHTRVEASPEPEWFEEYLWDGTFHWGEWTEPKQRDADGNAIDPIAHNPMAWFMADKGEVGTAYLHRSVTTVARIASLLGRTPDAERYAATAESVASAWRAAYLREDGTTVTDSQAAYVRALSFGLIPKALQTAAVDRLVELIRSAGTHLGTGFLATGDLLPVLADAGRADVAYELLHQRTAPSWLYMVDRGATTIWEDWEGIDEHGVAHDSLNHYSKGAVIRFLHTHTLGLRQDAESVAWERVVIAPVPAPGMTWARGSHDGPQGEIVVGWRIENGRFHITADIPAGTTARVVFPGGEVHTASPGRFRQSAALPASDLVPASR